MFKIAKFPVRSQIVREISRMVKNFSVHICPILDDNYSYFIVDLNTNKVAVVDPAEPPKVVDYFLKLQNEYQNKLQLQQVLTTHKHWDHAGGNIEMAKKFPGIEIVGSTYEAVDGVNKKVSEKTTFKIGNTNVKVLFTPCHTKGHVQYLLEDEQNKEYALFSGDTLFIAGCGRFFEGDAEQMWNNFIQLKQLDPSTKLYCGHEYTQSNIKFAKSVDPDNKDLQDMSAKVDELRSNKKPTIPTTLGQEFSFNPFLRSDDPTLQKKMNTSDPVSTLHALRKAKDNFK
ncbi:mitochondrial hydroxyacyl-glutathione hydrolase [Acrasis kona]|uniref:hydroxyacylglutathione hydrolase n=1 Tax=Acrasis kona TaxID=1008807 RepID=A0AAW2YHV6_9EUKA